jgi:hypothetical protein
MVVACCRGLSSSRELPHGCFGANLSLFPCFDRAEGLYDADTVVPRQAPLYVAHYGRIDVFWA